jgi:hypothetical protein
MQIDEPRKNDKLRNGKAQMIETIIITINIISLGNHSIHLQKHVALVKIWIKRTHMTRVRT